MTNSHKEALEKQKEQLVEMLKEMFEDGTIKVKTTLRVQNDNEISVDTDVLINGESVVFDFDKQESVSIYPPRNY